MPYELENQVLEHVFEEKDLGTIIDNALTFENHIESKINTANALVGQIRRTFTFLNKNIVIKLYTALVRHYLEYSQAVWQCGTHRERN